RGPVLAQAAGRVLQSLPVAERAGNDVFCIVSEQPHVFLAGGDRQEQGTDGWDDRDRLRGPTMVEAELGAVPGERWGGSPVPGHRGRGRGHAGPARPLLPRLGVPADSVPEPGGVAGGPRRVNGGRRVRGRLNWPGLNHSATAAGGRVVGFEGFLV